MTTTAESHGNTPTRDSVSQVGGFDRASADNKLAVNVTPFDVMSEYLRCDGEYSVDCVTWLMGKGYDQPDIGRLARRCGVPCEAVVYATNAFPPDVQGLIIVGSGNEESPKAMPDNFPDFEQVARVKVRADDPHTATSASRAWRVMEDANDPAQLFRFGNSLSWVEADRARAVVKPMTEKDFVHVQHREVQWYKVDSHGNEKESEPPERVIKDMLANPHPPIPNLVGIRPAPVFSPDGVLAYDWGYDASSKMFVWPYGLDISLVPERPTRWDIAKARHIIEVELLGDFPFDDDASRAHAICALLHPFARPIVGGPTPLHVIDKPTPGTGAGLLVEAITLPALGRAPDFTTVGKLEDEWRWKLVSMLRSGPAAMVIDNVNKVLDSAALAAVITTPDTFTDRRIGSSETITVPVRSLFIATGNNIELSSEITRRCVLIRLDANLEHPEEGREFRHDPLMKWAREYRNVLVWASLVLIQAWVAAGRPAGRERLGSFESWSETMGGILEVTSIPGFLDNRDKLRARSDAQSAPWRTFVEEWWNSYGARQVSSSDLLALAGDLMPERGDAGRSRSTSWGKLLKSKDGAVFAGKKLVYVGTKQGAAQWHLKPS